MPSPYPYALRTRVIAALEAKMTVSKIMELFKICRDTVYKWKNIKENTGDVKAKTGYQNGYSRKIIKDERQFLNFVITNEGKSLKELALLMPNKISTATLSCYLKKLNHTYKKNLLSSEKRSSGTRNFSRRGRKNS